MKRSGELQSDWAVGVANKPHHLLQMKRVSYSRTIVHTVWHQIGRQIERERERETPIISDLIGRKYGPAVCACVPQEINRAHSNPNNVSRRASTKTQSAHYNRVYMTYTILINVPCSGRIPDNVLDSHD